MALTASKSGGNFEPMPAGVHQLVCVDVNDEGIHENTFNPDKPQHKVSISWQSVDPLRDDGSRFLISKWYTLSLNERASLSELLTGWLDMSWEEIPQDFDLEELIGRNGRARIRHVPKKDGTGFRAEIVSMEPWEGAEEQAIGYIRKSDRPDYAAPTSRVQASNYQAEGAAPGGAAVQQPARPAQAQPAQSTPAALPSTPPELMSTLITQAVATFGQAAMPELEKLSAKVAGKGRTYSQLTEAQAGEVLQQLRAVTPAKAVKAKTAHLASEELADDDDPFGDEESDGTTTAQQQSAFKVPEPAAAYPAN